MKMRTRNPAASADIGSVIESETATHRYIAVQVAKMLRGERRRELSEAASISVPEKPWFEKLSGPFAALPDPTPAEMNPPASRLTHRDRPAAAGTDITLVGGRRGEFTHSKITVNDLVVGVARDAAADCALRTDDLLAFARDQHERIPWRMCSARTIKPSGSRAASLFAAASRPSGFWFATGGAKTPAACRSGGSSRRDSALTGRNECRTGPARRLAAAGRDARLPSRGSFNDRGRSVGPSHMTGVADGAEIARREHSRRGNALGTKTTLCLTRSTVVAAGCDDHFDRIVEIVLGKGGDGPRHRRREQQRSPLLR